MKRVLMSFGIGVVLFALFSAIISGYYALLVKSSVSFFVVNGIVFFSFFWFLGYLLLGEQEN